VALRARHPVLVRKQRNGEAHCRTLREEKRESGRRTNPFKHA
jgi:hypothetical protein